MSAPFIIGPDDTARIREAADKARLTPVPFETMKRLAKPFQDEVTSHGRAKELPEPQVVLLRFGWRLNITAEMQEIGRCLHLSLSSPTPKKTIARPEAVLMVMEALDRDGSLLNHWIENYDEGGQPGGKAVNVVIFDEKTAGTA